MSALLEVSGLGKRFGGFVALADVDLTVTEGERLGLIGPNGSGKSTLVNCLSGTLRHETGQVRFAGQSLNGLPAHQRTRLGMARSFQLPRPFSTMTLAENLRIPILYAVQARNKIATAEIGTGKDATIKEIAGLVATAVGYQGETVWDTTKPDGTPRKLLDVGKLHGLGWTARTSLADGLAATVAWFREHSGELREVG